MTHATRFVAVAVLVALGVGAPVQAQTPFVDALRVRAEAGNAEAQVTLGNRYEVGRGVPQDYAEAARLYRLAADQGYAVAQYDLGVSYRNGNGVLQDDVQAHMWLNLAASRMTGEIRETAGSLRDRTRARMTAE
jgi:TPR repeat protein